MSENGEIGGESAGGEVARGVNSSMESHGAAKGKE